MAIVLILVLSALAASTAAADPRYEVMNAPEGVYWRSEPNWAAAERVSGFGVYNGTIIEVHCYQSGTAVEGSADTMWEQATDVGGRGYGSGWVNEHFINDGQPINQPSPGVGPCNASPPPPPPQSLPPGSGGSGSSGGGSQPMIGGSAYYAPDNGNHPGAPSPATLTVPYNTWTSHSRQCGIENAGIYASWGGKLLTTLAGFSKGRLGPIYFLQANRSRWSQINYILLFDPGDKNEYEDTCDKRYPQSQLLAEWLSHSNKNRLVIIAGKVTADATNPDHGHAHAGIQDTLFPKIRGQAIAAQVLVCNYDKMGHWDVFKNFATYMNKPPITKGHCPQSAFGWNP